MVLKRFHLANGELNNYSQILQFRNPVNTVYRVCWMVLSRSVMSDSLLPLGLQPNRLLCLCFFFFFRQEYLNELPFPPPGYLPNPRIEPISPVSPVLQVDYLPTEPLRQPQKCMPGEIAKTQLEGPVLLGTAKTPARGNVKMKAKANNNKKSLSTNKQNLTVSTTNLTVMIDHLKSRKFTQPKPRRRQETGEESLELKSVLL